MRKLIEKYSEKPKGFFKKIFFTFLMGYIPFVFLHVLLNALDIIPVDYNEQDTYGLKGAIVIIAFAPFIVFMLSVSFWLYFIFGNIIIRLIKKIFYE